MIVIDAGLLAERIFDQLPLARVVTAEILAEPVGLRFDAAAATGAFEGGAELGAGEPGGLAGGGASLSSSRASGRHNPLVHPAKASRAAG
ncbi:hypothetical protein ACFW9Q_20750 [Streptomyces mirabilis]|uniref:hypothetical protein n=1 Tax=Streptomyces mirabilis TaxID=68239 RepID=UPI0036C8EE47